MPSRLLEYIDDLQPAEKSRDSVTKILNSAEALWALPSPTNVERQRQSIIDVPVTLIQSTTRKMPQRIIEIVNTSQSKNMLSDAAKSLLGLCLNGRGYPAALYVHRPLIERIDPSGDLFDNTFWHEFIHGLEGVTLSKAGNPMRRQPWSYNYQIKLSRMDAVSEVFLDTKKIPERAVTERMDYLRDGLDIQEHVSELFARVGVLMLRHVRTHHVIPQTKQDFYDFMSSFGLADLTSKLPEDAQMEEDDIKTTLYLHGIPAIRSIWKTMPEMVCRAAKLYGCDVSSLVRPSIQNRLPKPSTECS